MDREAREGGRQEEEEKVTERRTLNAGKAGRMRSTPDRIGKDHPV